MATNRDVFAMLSELITLTTLEEESPQSFKVRAYENAKLGLEAHGEDITGLTVTELTKIKGVGKATASKIRELVDGGSVEKVEKLRAKYPPEFVDLSRIPGVGPKKLKLIRKELGIENVEQLRQAIADEKLRDLPGMGETSEAKIAKAIDRLGLTGKDRRTPIADAMPLAERLVADFEAIPGVVAVEYCGSLRRMSETIGDIDITVASKKPAAVMKASVDHSECADVVVNGETKTSFLTREGLQIDVRVVEPDQFGAAVMYFTGSKAHNIALRQRALDRNMLLNEYGLIDTSDESLEGDDRPVVASKTEAEIYAALDMAYVEPPLREGQGEVEAAAVTGPTTKAKKKTPAKKAPKAKSKNDEEELEGLPELIQREHIHADLHYHTARSGDGRSSVEDMVKVAAETGYDFLAITDHGVDLAINGSTAEEMLEHRDHIARVQEEYPDMLLMWGCELNIDGKGGLDYDDDFRALFDYTVASVHSHYDQKPNLQTDRLIAAISDPTVNSIGHLSGRYIGRRPGIEFDVDAVLDALLHFDVALEVNGALQRLDAASDVVRRAVDREVKLVINTDSHHTSELGRMDYGVRTAQRGWAPKDLVVNSWDRDRFMSWVADRPKRT